MQHFLKAKMQWMQYLNISAYWIQDLHHQQHHLQDQRGSCNERNPCVQLLVSAISPHSVAHWDRVLGWVPVDLSLQRGWHVYTSCMNYYSNGVNRMSTNSKKKQVCTWHYLKLFQTTTEGGWQVLLPTSLLDIWMSTYPLRSNPNRMQVCWYIEEIMELYSLNFSSKGGHWL